MCSVPFNVTPHEYAVTWLKSDEGLEALKMLESFSE
jgi:hypothetical protein